MQILQITFFVAVAGTLIPWTLSQNVYFPENCTMADPFYHDHAAINMTFNPVLDLLAGSTLDNIVAEGLSTFSYKLEVNPMTLVATFEMYIAEVTWNATYNAEGYLDARPFRQETIPSGNFTGSDVGWFSAKHVKLSGSGTIFFNLQGKVQLSRLVLVEANFESLSVDLGTSFMVGGEAVDWDELNRNIKANFDQDMSDNKNAIQERIRLATNEFLKYFTLQEIIDILEIINLCSGDNITPTTSPTTTISTTTEKNLPECPFEDPLIRDQADLDVTFDPIFNLLLGSAVENLMVQGLSNLRYEVDVNALLLTLTFEMDITHVTGNATYDAEGYMDARPFRQETIPSGNFTGKDFGQLSAANVKLRGSASIFMNLQGKVQISRLVLAEASFRSLSVDLGQSFLIGGGAVDWAELSRNIKANFDRDLADNKKAIQDKIRLGVNEILKQFTHEELYEILLELQEHGGECSPKEPPPTTTTPSTTTASTTTTHPTTTTRSTTTEGSPVTPPDGVINGTCPDGLEDGQACDPLTECNQCGYCDFYFHCQAQSPRTGEWRKTRCSMRGDPITDIIRVEDKMFFHIGATPFGGMCAPGIPAHLEEEYVGDPSCRSPSKFWPDEDCQRAYWHSDPDYSKGIWSDPGTRLLCSEGAKWEQEIFNCVFCEEGDDCDCE